MNRLYDKLGRELGRSDSMIAQYIKKDERSIFNE